MRKSIFAVAIACCLLGGVTSTAIAAGVERPNVSLKLDWTFQGPESIFVYGKHLGYFKDEGLNVDIRRGEGTSKTIARVAAGTVDFGWAGVGGVIKFDLQHPEAKTALEAVYITEAHSPDTIVTIKGRGIKTPKDLAGKTLDATAGSGAMALFGLFAKRNGFDPSSVHWKTVSGALREPLMVRGDADALAGFTTSSILTVHKLGVPMDKIVVFRYSDYGGNQYGRALIVRKAFAEKYPNTVRAMVAAANKSLLAAIKDPLASAKTLPSRDPTVNVATECTRLRDGLVHLTLSKRYKTDGISSVNMERLTKAISDVKEGFQMSGNIKADAIYTAKFLPPQKDRIPPALGSCK